jgi:hypothetical protein
VALGVRPAAVTLRVGATSRDKVYTVEVAVGADATAVEQRLRALRGGA